MLNDLSYEMNEQKAIDIGIGHTYPRFNFSLFFVFVFPQINMKAFYIYIIHYTCFLCALRYISVY